MQMSTHPENVVQPLIAYMDFPKIRCRPPLPEQPISEVSQMAESGTKGFMIEDF